MYSVFIGMCSGGTVRVETMTSVIAAMDLLKEKGVDVGLSVMVGGYTAHNRNKLVAQAKERQATHLMFIDADQTFAASGIMRLLDNDKDIIGGMYNTRGNVDKEGRLLSTLKLLDPATGEFPLDGHVESYEIPRKLFKAGGLGTGFMLIKMSTFERLKRPYFIAWETDEGEHRTEDIQFCINARAAGLDVWCNPTIQIGHIGTREY